MQGLKNNQAVVERPPPDMENSLSGVYARRHTEPLALDYFFFSPLS
jgi:hypothetical protein